MSVLGARPHAGRPRRQRRTDADHQEGTSNERVVFAGRAAAVAEVLTGTFRPEGFIGLYKWPSAQSAEAFRLDPRWPPIEATRPRIFRELRVHTTALDDDLTLGLNGDCAYEIQFLWLSRDDPAAYREYAETLPAILGELGGRVLANLAVGSYESLQPWPHQPDEVVILEWPDTATHTAHLASDGFLGIRPLLHAGVANAESFLTRPSFE